MTINRENDMPLCPAANENDYLEKRGALAYICNFNDTFVSLVEVPAGRKVLDIPLGFSPYDIDISPDRGYAYVSIPSEAILLEISTCSNRVLHAIDLNTPSFSSSKPCGVKVSSDGSLIYVANNESQNISVVDAKRKQVATVIPLEDKSSPVEIDITADGGLAFVTLYDHARVAVVDLQANLTIKYINVGKNAFGIAVARKYPLALTANADPAGGSVSVINTSIAEASPNTVAVGIEPKDVVLNHFKDIAYVSNCTDGTVSVVDIFTHRQLSIIPVGKKPNWLALTADGRFLVVSNEGSNTASIIDTALLQVVATADAGKCPKGIAILS